MRRPSGVFNNVKIDQGQLRLIIKHILFYHIWGLQPFWSNDLKQSNEYSIKQSICGSPNEWHWIKGYRSA